MFRGLSWFLIALRTKHSAMRQHALLPLARPRAVNFEVVGCFSGLVLQSCCVCAMLDCVRMLVVGKHTKIVCPLLEKKSFLESTRGL